MPQPILFPLTGVHSNLNGTGLRKRGRAPNFCGGRRLPAVSYTLTGVTRDSIGAALPGCTCTLFRVVTSNSIPQFIQVAVTVSDGSGNYSFPVGSDGPWRVTFDLDGAPARAGLTVKTLSGV